MTITEQVLRIFFGDKIDDLREIEKGLRTITKTDEIETQFKNVLKAPIIKNLAICTDEEFSKYIDDMFSRNYKSIPAVIRLPDLNGHLTQKLHLANVHCYMEKKRFNHINPQRKASHNNQDFRKEEYKMIPRIIRNALSWTRNILKLPKSESLMRKKQAMN